MADVRGEVETSEDGVLVIRRIHASFRNTATEEKRNTIDRVHSVYANKCPIFRSLSSAIQTTSSYSLVAS